MQVIIRILRAPILYAKGYVINKPVGRNLTWCLWSKGTISVHTTNYFPININYINTSIIFTESLTVSVEQW